MIKYQSGYKYQLVNDYKIRTYVIPKESITSFWIELDNKGNLGLRLGYAWDGPSGPTIDTKNFMRGSLVHDALYQLMRQGYLDIEWREQADKELKRICLEDGMSKIRAWWVYKAVRTFAKRCAEVSNKRKILTAP